MGMNRAMGVVMAVVILGITVCEAVSAENNYNYNLSTLSDPANDLIYIYTGDPIPEGEYIGYVDVIMGEVNKTASSLNFSLTMNGSILPQINTTFWTLLLDENNEPGDNCPDYPIADVDTMYSVIYHSTIGEWKIERAVYETCGWAVKPTNATWGIISTWPNGRVIVQVSIPLTELEGLSGVLPWKIKTETSNGAPIGDLAPDEGLVYLGNPPPAPRIYNPDDGSWICGVTGIGVIEERNASDIVSTLFEYSMDGETWYNISIDYDGNANTFPRETYNASWDGWGTLWNTTGMAEGWYYIRATMKDDLNQTGQSQIRVYLDPTPPSPAIIQPAFDQVVNGTFTITATVEDEDVSGVIFSLFRIKNSSGIEKNVPHTPQGWGCGPASAAASLLWLDNYTNESGVKIFDDLVPPDLEEPENLTAKLNQMFKTDNKDPPGVIGVHETTDSNLIAGLKDYIKERKKAGMKEDFVVKAFGRERTAIYEKLPKNTDWIKFYKTMLPHEDILLLLEAKTKAGSDWGHMVTANSFLSTLEIWWTPEGCIWAQIPPYKIDVMDHNNDTGYPEVGMDENGNITGLEKYYDELQGGAQKIGGMFILSPKVTYKDLSEALNENRSTSYDWLPIGYGEPSEMGFFLNWDTTGVEDGSYLLMATVMDEAGNEDSDIIWITVDNGAPHTTKTIGTPSYGDYLTSYTEISLSADDEGVGVDSIYYRIWNNGSWSNWTRTGCGMGVNFTGCIVNLTLPGNCTHHVEYYAVDMLGNAETVHNQTHIVDNEAPITTMEVGEPSYFVNTSIGEYWMVTNGTPITLNGSDDCCKIRSIRLKNKDTEKTYHVIMGKERGGYSPGFVRPNDEKRFSFIFGAKKLNVTISEYKKGKKYEVEKFALSCSDLQIMGELLWSYKKEGNCFRYNESIGMAPFGIKVMDLLLEEFCLEECTNESEGRCWSGINATMYREWYNGVWTEWKKYTTPFTLEGEGVHYIEYYSMDNLGNAEGINNETFFVTRPTLEPFFMTPSNNSLIYNNVTLWVGEPTGRAIDYVTFWYSADGVNWTYTGVDGDGSEPTVGGELVNASDWGDGWSVHWNTSGMKEGWYHIKAILVGLEEMGTTQICAYLDPTPPLPKIYEPSDEDVVRGAIQLRADCSDENIKWALWEYLNKAEYYEKEIEEKIQFNYCRNISGKNLSGVCCGPTAAASCLKYWAERGYPRITGNGTINQSELVNRLARLMKTNENGTKLSNFKKGIEDYLKECGYGSDNPGGLKVEVEVDTNELNFTRYRNEIEAKRGNVLWLYRWNHNSSSCKWRNGHIVVGKSVNNSRRGDGSHEVDIMCPTYGVVNVSMYDNGSFYRPDIGGWRYPSAMVTVSEKSFNDPGWVKIANITDPAGGWATTWDTTGVKNGYYFIRVTIVDETGNEGRAIIVVKVDNIAPVRLDTGGGTYPSIAGVHEGFIIPNETIEVRKIYIYPCAGTGGHAEFVEIRNESFRINASWEGYKGDYHNLTFSYPFKLMADEVYRYKIVTGSYPEIIHNQSYITLDGSFINCTSFVDVNGRIHDDWIPAFRLVQ